MARIYNELRNYQNVPRELVFDKDLSDRARFVYVFMACKPDDWDFYLEPMAKDIGYSVDTLRKYINELVASGWLVKGEQSNEHGIFGAVEYTLKAAKFTDTENFRYGKNAAQENIDNISLPNTNETYNKEINKEEKEKEDKSSKKDDEIDDFVEKIYKLYPTKCPIRGTSLSKSHADKKRIKALLKKYTEEQILMVVENEINNKYGKYSLKNFSTFLNNFPDPSEMCENSMPKQNTLFDNLPTGMIIRETQEERNEKFKNEKGW